MKKRIVSITMMVAVMLLTNCAPKGTLVSKRGTPEDALAVVKKKYSDAQAREGKRIWEAACTACHSLIAPEGHSIEAWQHILPRMIRRSRVTDEQADQIWAYVLTHAERMHKADPKPRMKSMKVMNE